MAMTTAERLHISKAALDAVYETFGKTCNKDSLREIGAATMAHCDLLKTAVIEHPTMGKKEKGALLNLLNLALDKAQMIEFGGTVEAIAEIMNATRHLETA